MGYRLEVTQDAQQEALTALRYYEQQRTGLGKEFIDELNNQYILLVANPQHYGYASTKLKVKLRKVKIRRFPYLVLFRVYKTKVVIYSVHNTYTKNKRFY